MSRRQLRVILLEVADELVAAAKAAGFVEGYMEAMKLDDARLEAQFPETSTLLMSELLEKDNR